MNFKGYLYIDNLKLNFSFSNGTDGVLSTTSENGYVKIYGSLYTNDKFDKFAIISNGWSTKSGYTIAAPANDRSEALRVSNDVMKEFLNKFNINELR